MKFLYSIYRLMKQKPENRAPRRQNLKGRDPASENISLQAGKPKLFYVVKYFDRIVTIDLFSSE